jgi:4-amino-4-deoxychorismate lyase
MYLFFNGGIIKEEDLRLTSDNRALNYGDGLFETMKFSAGKISYLNDHLERMYAGAKAFHLRIPRGLSDTSIQKNITELSLKNKLDEGRVKILLWRKSGGLFSPESEEADCMILLKEWHGSPAEKQKVIFSSERKSYSALSAYKLLSSATYIMAGIEKQKKGADDVIILNHSNEVVECLSSTIFWEKDSQLFTPALKTGCIEGVMRKQIIEKLKNDKIPVREGHYSTEELLRADFVFTSNIGGLSRIRSIENTEFKKESSIFKELKQIVNE